MADDKTTPPADDKKSAGETPKTEGAGPAPADAAPKPAPEVLLDKKGALEHVKGMEGLNDATRAHMTKTIEGLKDDVKLKPETITKVAQDTQTEIQKYGEGWKGEHGNFKKGDKMPTTADALLEGSPAATAGKTASKMTMEKATEVLKGKDQKVIDEAVAAEKEYGGFRRALGGNGGKIALAGVALAGAGMLIPKKKTVNADGTEGPEESSATRKALVFTGGTAVVAGAVAKPTWGKTMEIAEAWAVKHAPQALR